jgi:hypothetical protein
LTEGQQVIEREWPRLLRGQRALQAKWQRFRAECEALDHRLGGVPYFAPVAWAAMIEGGGVRRIRADIAAAYGLPES